MNDSSRFICIDGFAEELDELVYHGISNWFITYRSLFTVYSAHFSYLLVFFSIIGCGLLSYRHSSENGSKYKQFWWGALLHGFLSERGLTASKYWHAQAPIMLFGKQLPLHIVFLYPSILYVSMMAVHRLELNICVEPAAVGLISMLMEIPYRMISVKFLHITYHDTYPLYKHKLCGVPWVEILSSLVLASSYAAIYNGAKLYKSRDLDSVWDKNPSSKKETLITVACGVAAPVAGFVQKVIFFHFFNDLFNINPVSCLFFTISIYLSFIVCFEPRKLGKHVTEDTTGKRFLFSQLVLFMSCLLFLALFGRPQNEISIGTHEPTGDCSTLICSRTPLGKRIKRKKYLCAEEVSARKNFVYNFECLEDGPPCLSAIWYTICGSPIHNKPQFFLNIFSFCLLIFSFFAKSLFRDVKKMEVLKQLIVKFRRRRGGASETPNEEVTVGFVFTSYDKPFLSKDYQKD